MSLGTTWHKPSFSSATNCVEVRQDPGTGEVMVRNTEAPGVALIFPPTDWAPFVGAVKAGEYDPVAV